VGLLGRRPHLGQVLPRPALAALLRSAGSHGRGD
jgi:hypothetical protein